MNTAVHLKLADNGNVQKWDRTPFPGSYLITANPGSDVAVKCGCTCPILDNGNGNEELGAIRGFYISQGCPVHDPKESVE